MTVIGCANVGTTLGLFRLAPSLERIPVKSNHAALTKLCRVIPAKAQNPVLRSIAGGYWIARFRWR